MEADKTGADRVTLSLAEPDVAVDRRADRASSSCHAQRSPITSFQIQFSPQRIEHHRTASLLRFANHPSTLKPPLPTVARNRKTKEYNVTSSPRFCHGQNPLPGTCFQK